SNFWHLEAWEKCSETTSNHESVILKPYIKDKKEVPRRPTSKPPPTNEKRKYNKKGNPKNGKGCPPRSNRVKVLNIELSPRDPGKITRIGSQMEDTIRKEVIQCLQRNIDIFTWTPHDLEGIDPNVITHYLNINPNAKLVKQHKRHFGLKKDKIIQAEVDKLMALGHIEEIQFPEWLSNVVLVLKPGGKWRMCIDFRDLNKARPKDCYPLPRIDQLVQSTSGCEVLSMMDASQRYQIMLAPEDRKRSIL
ncbi:UNVERIFIED_CONTAM: Transposon Ty3-G Gag-Pol polyprotein, partial [Sesamum angustifolium]